MPTSPTSLAAAARAPIWLGMLVLYVVWGSTYLGSRSRSRRSRRSSWRPIRFVLAGLILLDLVDRARGRAFARRPGANGATAPIVGALLLGGGMGMVALGEQTVPSGIAALLVAMMPVWVASSGASSSASGCPRWRSPASRRVRRRRHPRRAAALGGAGRARAAGLAALILSPISWAIGSLFASHRARPAARPLVATGVQMLLGGARPRGHGASLTGEFGAFDPPRSRASRSLALALPDASRQPLAFTTFGWLLRVAPLPLSRPTPTSTRSSRSSSGVVLGEPIDPRTIVAGAIIVVAVALIVTARGRMPPPTARATRRGRVGAGDRPRRAAAPRRPRRRPEPRPAQVSASTVRATRRASAMTVIIGLTPSPSGTATRRRRRGRRRARRRGAGADPAPRIAGMVARVGAHPGRAHLVGREHGPRGSGAKSNAASAASNRAKPAASSPAPADARAVPGRRRPDGDDLGRPGGARQPGHRHQRVPQRRDAGRVEPVVDPDAAGPGQGRASLAAVPGDRDERRQMRRTPAITPACASRPLPRQGQREETGWPGADSMT